MCCPLIVFVMAGVSTKAYSDPCGCQVDECLTTPPLRQPQEHNVNNGENALCRSAPPRLWCCSSPLNSRAPPPARLLFLFFPPPLSQAATRSPPCSVTLRLLCCVSAVPPSSASPREGKLASQKVQCGHRTDWRLAPIYKRTASEAAAHAVAVGGVGKGGGGSEWVFLGCAACRQRANVDARFVDVGS